MFVLKTFAELTAWSHILISYWSVIYYISPPIILYQSTNLLLLNHSVNVSSDHIYFCFKYLLIKFYLLVILLLITIRRFLDEYVIILNLHSIFQVSMLRSPNYFFLYIIHQNYWFNVQIYIQEYEFQIKKYH